jgi:NADH-quinone oxidoreductase subunit C
VRVGPLVERLAETLTPLGAVREEKLAGAVLVVPRASLLEAATTARELGFDLLLDVFGIDWMAYPGHRGPRFSVSYHVHALAANERCLLRVHLDDHDEVATVTGVWPAANFMERETYDLFGVTFDGHPDLRKLVTPDDLEGHALRKDFPIGETPTLFNEGRFLDPASFRAGMIGVSTGHTGWVGGARKGVVSDPPVHLDLTPDENGGAS